MSSAASVFDAGSRTRPFLTSSMRGVLLIGGAAILGRQRLRQGMRALFGRAGDEQKEQRHSNGNAVGDLLEHAGLRAVGDLGCDLISAVHWARMQDKSVGLGAAKAL